MDMRDWDRVSQPLGHCRLARQTIPRQRAFPPMSPLALCLRAVPPLSRTVAKRWILPASPLAPVLRSRSRPWSGTLPYQSALKSHPGGPPHVQPRHRRLQPQSRSSAVVLGRLPRRSGVSPVRMLHLVWTVVDRNGLARPPETPTLPNEIGPARGIDRQVVAFGVRWAWATPGGP